MPFTLLHGKVMAGLHCVCGDSFMASCDIDPGSCAVAWLLLIVSTMVHAARCCAWGGDDEGWTVMTRASRVQCTRDRVIYYGGPGVPGLPVDPGPVCPVCQ